MPDPRKNKYISDRNMFHVQNRPYFYSFLKSVTHGWCTVEIFSRE